MSTLLFILACVLFAVGVCVATFLMIMFILNRLTKDAIAKGLRL